MMGWSVRVARWACLCQQTGEGTLLEYTGTREGEGVILRFTADDAVRKIAA
jgi:hypothetical protein